MQAFCSTFKLIPDLMQGVDKRLPDPPQPVFYLAAAVRTSWEASSKQATRELIPRKLSGLRAANSDQGSPRGARHNGSGGWAARYHQKQDGSHYRGRPRHRAGGARHQASAMSALSNQGLF